MDNGHRISPLSLWESYAPLAAGHNLGLMAMEQLPAMLDAFAKRTLGWVER